MQLTQLQKHLVRTMKHSEGMDADTAATILTGLETEEQQWMMLDWMDNQFDKEGKYPEMGRVLNIFGKIVDEMPPPEETPPEA